MGNPTRLKNGVSVYNAGLPLANFPLPDKNYICAYQDDFHNYVAGDWTVTADGGSTAVTQGTTYPGGTIVLTTATSGTKAISLGTATDLGNAFRFKAGMVTAAGEDTWFKARIYFNTTVTNPDIAVGLGRGGVATFNAATDGVYFTKATGAPFAGTTTGWNLVMKAAAGTTTTIALPVIPTISIAQDLAYYFDGSDNTLYVWVNGVFLGTVNADYGSLGKVMTGIPASTLFLSPFISNSYHTATSTVELDYVTAGSTLGR